MANFLAIEKAQNDVVRAVAASVTDVMDGEWGDREWLQIAVNFEIEVADRGRRISAQSAAIAHRPGQPLEAVDFALSDEADAAMIALREAMRDDHGAWNSCDLTIERSGKYRFDFSHAPPRRLGGDLLHAPLDGYLQRYLAGNGQAGAA